MAGMDLVVFSHLPNFAQNLGKGLPYDAYNREYWRAREKIVPAMHF